MSLMCLFHENRNKLFVRPIIDCVPENQKKLLLCPKIEKKGNPEVKCHI